MNKDQIVAFTIFTLSKTRFSDVYVIFYVTMGTDRKFHWPLKCVRMTTKSGSVLNIDAFTQFNINSVLLNRFCGNKMYKLLFLVKSIMFCLVYSFPKVNIQNRVKSFESPYINLRSHLFATSQIFLQPFSTTFDLLQQQTDDEEDQCSFITHAGITFVVL